MKRHARYIIKPPGAYKEFWALARRNGLRLIDKIEKAERSPMALQEIFTNIDNTVGIHYIEDGLSEIPYIQISGPQLDYYSRVIEQGLPVYSRDELFFTWDTANSIDDKIDAVLRLGIAASGQPSDPYLSRIRQGLEDAAPEVRSAALVAFSYNLWDSLKPVIEQIRDQDSDSDARDRARLVLDTWQRQASA